ncbi:MAG: hypothetical protein ACLSGS_06450 [Adlercreutzia sp.]
MIDLDVVNPFFRSSDYRALLDERGIRAPCSRARTWTDQLVRHHRAGHRRRPASLARRRRASFVVIDAGGDDAGATALGRFARTVEQAPYEMLYVVNATQPHAGAGRGGGGAAPGRAKSHLRATCVVNNTCSTRRPGGRACRSRGGAQAAGLPLACTTVPAAAARQVADRETTTARRMGIGKRTILCKYM